MPVPPAPSQLLNDMPPSPEGVPAKKPQRGPFEALQPDVSPQGGVQVVELVLQTAAALDQGISLLSDMIPDFAPTGAQLNQQLRAAIKTALEQGLGNPEPAPQAALLNKLSVRQ